VTLKWLSTVTWSENFDVPWESNLDFLLVNNTFRLRTSKRFQVIQIHAIWLGFPTPVHGYATSAPLLDWGDPLTQGQINWVSKKLGSRGYHVAKSRTLYLTCARIGSGTYTILDFRDLEMTFRGHKIGKILVSRTRTTTISYWWTIHFDFQCRSVFELFNYMWFGWNFLFAYRGAPIQHLRSRGSPSPKRIKHGVLVSKKSWFWAIIWWKQQVLSVLGSVQGRHRRTDSQPDRIAVANSPSAVLLLWQADRVKIEYIFQFPVMHINFLTVSETETFDHFFISQGQNHKCH
jgi:hypothetical protein